MPRPPAFVLALLLLASAASGCDLFGSDAGTVVVTGRVVTADTSEPITGLGLSFREGGGAYPIRALTRTDVDGSFAITFDHGETNRPFFLTVNDEPYDARYATYTASIRQGTERDLGVIELEESPAP